MHITVVLCFLRGQGATTHHHQQKPVAIHCRAPPAPRPACSQPGGGHAGAGCQRFQGRARTHRPGPLCRRRRLSLAAAPGPHARHQLWGCCAAAGRRPQCDGGAGAGGWWGQPARRFCWQVFCTLAGMRCPPQMCLHRATDAASLTAPRPRQACPPLRPCALQGLSGSSKSTHPFARVYISEPFPTSTGACAASLGPKPKPHRPLRRAPWRNSTARCWMHIAQPGR